MQNGLSLWSILTLVTCFSPLYVGVSVSVLVAVTDVRSPFDALYVKEFEYGFPTVKGKEVTLLLSRPAVS